LPFLFSMLPTAPRPTLFPYTTLFRSPPARLLPAPSPGRAEHRGAALERLRLRVLPDRNLGDPESLARLRGVAAVPGPRGGQEQRSEEHTSELQSRGHLVCRLLLEKKK